MNERQARRIVRRRAAEFCREMERDPGVTGGPDNRALLVSAWGWLALFLDAKVTTAPLPANLRPLVRPDGTEPDEWRAPDTTTTETGTEQDS